jgi:hypothetical protein
VLRVNADGRSAARGYWLGFVAIAIVSIGVPSAWYALGGVIWIPTHDDMVSLMLCSEGKWRAGPVLEPSRTSVRSVREILEIVEPRPDYGAARTALDAYRLSINPPVYLALLNLWRRAFGGSFGAALILSMILCGLSACAFYVIVARRVGWATALLISALYCFTPTYWETALSIRNYGLSTLVSVVLAGALAWLVSATPDGHGRATALFVACGALLTLTAYQSTPLVLSLLAGLLAITVLRGDRAFASSSIRAAAALVLACAPILLVARWQGIHGGARGVVVDTLPAHGDMTMTLRAALQVLLSLFLDLPYGYLPLAALAAAVLLLLGALARLAAAERRAPAIGTLLAVALPTACLVYAVLVLLRIFPAWFARRYFAAYAAAYLVLLALIPPPTARAVRMRRIAFGALLGLSAGTFAVRAGQYAAIGRHEDRAAMEALRGAPLILTDARHDAQVLRIAAHASPEAKVWLLRLPLDADTCRAITEDASTASFVLVRAGEVEAATLDGALRTCLPEGRARARYTRSWLDLTILDPATTQPDGAS